MHEESSQRWLLSTPMLQGRFGPRQHMGERSRRDGCHATHVCGRKSISRSVYGILSHHYPESLRKVYVVNAPRGVGTVWSIVRQFLDANKVFKVEVLSKPSDLSEKLGDMSPSPPPLPAVAEAVPRVPLSSASAQPCPTFWGPGRCKRMWPTRATPT